MNTEHLRGLLRERYRRPEWVIYFEVPNRIHRHTRRADAVAVSLFPSRGLEVHGFEIKTGRKDWMTELENPLKAEESAWAYCDKWWIVAPKDIVRSNELPTGWGWLCPNDDASALEVASAPAVNKAPIFDKQFMTILLNCAHEVGEKMYSDGCRVGAERATREGVNSIQRVDELERRISSFQDETGLRVTDNDYQTELRKEVKRFTDSVKSDLELNIRPTIDSLQKKREALNRAIQELEQLDTAPRNRRRFFTQHNEQKEHRINLDASNP